MATKTIIATVTLHVPGPHFLPFKFSDAGIATEGKYDIVEAAPGMPVTLDADEADRLISLGIASVYIAPVPASAPVPVEASPVTMSEADPAGAPAASAATTKSK